MGSPVGSPFGYYINMLLGLEIDNYFWTWEGYLVVFSLGTLDGLMIGTVERYLVGLSLGLPPVYPLESPYLGLTGTILAMYLGNTLVSLIDSIWHINWCGTRIDNYQLLWNFNWVPSLLLICLGILNTDWKYDGTFTLKLSGQVYWEIYRIVFVLLFVSPLQALFDSNSWYNVL